MAEAGALVVAIPAMAFACGSGDDHVNWTAVLCVVFAPVLVLTPLKIVWLRSTLDPPGRAAAVWGSLLVAKPAGLLAAWLCGIFMPGSPLTIAGYVVGHALAAIGILQVFDSDSPVKTGVAMSILFPLLHVAGALALIEAAELHHWLTGATAMRQLVSG